MVITKSDAAEAKKILKIYERQKNAEERAKRCAMPCTATVYNYLKARNDGYGYDAWDDTDKKLYRTVKNIEQNARRRRIKGQVEIAEIPRIRRHRWTEQMKNALADGDTAYLHACGVTDAAIAAMRNKLSKENATGAMAEAEPAGIEGTTA